jgi:predicted N-acetyltransferase YhbS
VTGIVIRPEEHGDRFACEALVRDAFWDVYKPGCDEHLILHKARNSPDFVPDLDLVAVEDGRIIGCILATRARVVNDAEGTSHDVICLGPVAVRPDRQQTGVGSSLIRAVLERAGRLGGTAAFLYGNPAYYSKFGFEDARRWHVTTSQGKNFEAFMGIELIPDGLDEISGRLMESTVFTVDPAEVEEFEHRFPPREKHVTSTQLGH